MACISLRTQVRGSTRLLTSMSAKVPAAMVATIAAAQGAMLYREAVWRVSPCCWKKKLGIQIEIKNCPTPAATEVVGCLCVGVQAAVS